MLAIPIDYNKRIYGYDLLRAYAIFRVVNGHGGHLLKGTFLEGFPWFTSPSGVDIFFVLSGFLIGYSFISNIAKKGEKAASALSFNFWKRSSLRILPNYFLILLVNYLFVYWGIINGDSDKFSILLFATFTQNLFYPFYGFFWESWSIAVQEWFYLLFPISLIISTRFLKIKQASLLFAFLLIGISLVYRTQLGQNEFDQFFWDLNFRKIVLSRLDSIAYGLIAAWIRFYYGKQWGYYAIPSFIIGVLVFASVLYIPFKINTFYANVIFFCIPPSSVSFLLPLLDKFKNVKTVMGRFISHIGILSYALYLTNLLIIQIINLHFSNYLSSNGVVDYLFYWFITLVFSYLLYTLVENPIVKYGNKLLHTQKMMYKRKVNSRLKTIDLKSKNSR